MRVSLKKAFTILDGRLSTKMDDVYEMLNFIFSENLYTHQIPTAMRKLKELNPDWFSDGVNVVESIKQNYNTNDFQELMEIIDKEFYAYEIELGKVNKIFRWIIPRRINTQNKSRKKLKGK